MSGVVQYQVRESERPILEDIPLNYSLFTRKKIISIQSANCNGCYKCSGCYQHFIDLSLLCGYLVLHSHFFSLLAPSLESSLDLLSRDNFAPITTQISII